MHWTNVLTSGKTNALGYELFAIVGEVNGQAVLLAFMCITPAKEASVGTKELVL